MANSNTTIPALGPSNPPETIPLVTTTSFVDAVTTIIETTTSYSTFIPSTEPPPPPPAPTSESPTPVKAPTAPPAVAPTPQIVTSVVIASPSSNGTPLPPTTVIITSTVPIPVTPTPTVTPTSTTSQTSSTSSGAAALQGTSGSNSQESSGLNAGGKIAVAVVVPVAAVALIVLALLFLWRRRKQRKDAEELRRKEVEEYGFNPNNDPTLPVAGVVRSHSDEPSEMRETDGAGYRGWGTTTTARQPSTTLSSGNGPIGIARSDSGSNPGGYHGGLPTPATATNSDVQSGDPLVGSTNNGRPTTADSETIGALGAAPTSMGNRQDREIHRGPSNASSAYSGANRSENSGEGPLPGTAISPQYYNDGMYYDESVPQHGTYSDGTYGGVQQPVIRDVQARRNTRIENPAVFPQQGNAGIAQNF